MSAAAAAIKITIIGDAHVGKSSIVRRVTFDNFSENERSTVGAAFCSKTYRNRKYHIWDTAGQERYAALVPLYLSGASIIILVYDVTCSFSFQRIGEYWLPYVRENLRLRDDDPLPMMFLIGNKVDIADTIPGARVVSEKQGKELAAEHAMGFVEVSARTGLNSDSIMEVIANYADQMILNQADDILRRSSSTVNLTDAQRSGVARCFGYSYSSC